MLAITIFITPPLYVSRIMDSVNIRRKAPAATKDSAMDILIWIRIEAILNSVTTDILDMKLLLTKEGLFFN